MTPYQQPILDQVPGVRGLHIVSGGSYHSFKFFPIWGDIVQAYLQGERKGVSRRWGWDRSGENISIHGDVLPPQLED